MFLLSSIPKVPKSIEPRCWKHLHRSPFPINGVYQVYHRAARNHFRRHADIKHRGGCGFPLTVILPWWLVLLCWLEEDHVSIQDVANDQSSYPRARGWKLKHFSTQLLEMVSVQAILRGVMLGNPIDHYWWCWVHCVVDAVMFCHYWDSLYFACWAIV